MIMSRFVSVFPNLTIAYRLCNTFTSYLHMERMRQPLSLRLPLPFTKRCIPESIQQQKSGPVKIYAQNYLQAPAE